MDNSLLNETKIMRPIREKIEQFKSDVISLGLSHTRIAKKMGLDKSNFSNYYLEKHSHPITTNFLEKFYTAWENDIPKVSRKIETNNKDLLDIIDKALESNLKLTNNFEKIIDINTVLVKNIQTIVESNNKLIAAHLSFFTPRSLSSDQQRDGI